MEKYRFPRQKGEDGERTIQLPEPIKGTHLSWDFFLVIAECTWLKRDIRSGLDTITTKDESEEELDPYLRAAEASSKKKTKRKAQEPPKVHGEEEDPMAEYLAKKKRKEERKLRKAQKQEMWIVSNWSWRSSATGIHSEEMKEISDARRSGKQKQRFGY